MLVLFEGHPYERALLSGLLGEDVLEPAGGVRAAATCVGYAMPRPGQAVFVLPKVFLRPGRDGQSRFLGGPSPEQLLCPGAQRQRLLQETGGERLLCGLSLALYQAIRRYQARPGVSASAHGTPLPLISCRTGPDATTMLDLFISLSAFWRRNRGLCTVVSRLGRSGGRITWKQTMAAQLPAVTAAGPVYRAPLRRQLQPARDDELLVMLHSVLHHLAGLYGTDHGRDDELQPRLQPAEFRRLLQGRGVLRLRAIRSRYYRDVMRELWGLLHAFFDRQQTLARAAHHEEALLCGNFQLVFEDMVENLIGGDGQDLPRHLRRQRDGRVVDHLFRAADLLNCRDTYYVADSKYYQPGHEVMGEALEKQYSYAINIIQYQIDDLLGSGRTHGRVRSQACTQGIFCRDELTEAYNVMPNFLIRGTVTGPDASTPGLRLRGSPQRRVHFPNRLFDRDTLFVLTFEINFLFVLAAYVRRSAGLRRRFRDEARLRMRQACLDALNEAYVFHQLAGGLSGEELEAFVREHFWELHGKICRLVSGRKPGHRERLILALERGCQAENALLMHKFAAVLGPAFRLS